MVSVAVVFRSTPERVERSSADFGEVAVGEQRFEEPQVEEVADARYPRARCSGPVIIVGRLPHADSSVADDPEALANRVLHQGGQESFNRGGDFGRRGAP